MSKTNLIDLVKKYFPSFSVDDCYEVLWTTTCYPFGNSKDIEKNLQELKENTDNTVEGMIKYTYNKIDEHQQPFKINS
jgi:hypothetical protein